MLKKKLSICWTNGDKTHILESRWQNLRINDWLKVKPYHGDRGVEGEKGLRVRWSGVDGLPFWSKVSTSEAATSDILNFWVWAMENQWLWAYLSLSMFQRTREKSRKRQSSRDSLTHWALEAFLGLSKEIFLDWKKNQIALQLKI